jgi:hypothetical protein
LAPSSFFFFSSSRQFRAFMASAAHGPPAPRALAVK